MTGALVGETLGNISDGLYCFDEPTETYDCLYSPRFNRLAQGAIEGLLISSFGVFAVNALIDKRKSTES